LEGREEIRPLFPHSGLRSPFVKGGVSLFQRGIIILCSELSRAGDHIEKVENQNPNEVSLLPKSQVSEENSELNFLLYLFLVKRNKGESLWERGEMRWIRFI
jgi:hypothetical protein